MSELIDKIKNGSVVSELELEKDINKPWGAYITYARNVECTSKLLVVENNLSIQSHENRDETWQLVHGSAIVYRGEIMESVELTIANLKPTIMSLGDLVHIPRGMVHTVARAGDDAALIVETSLGHAEEGDIRRFYDKHSRVPAEGLPSGLNTKEIIAWCKEKTSKV